MDYKTRILPTREVLSRGIESLKKTDTDIVGVDLVLSLITTVDLIRNSIYAKLSDDYGISEGKFILLMSLYGEGETTSSELALRIGVTPATVSIMVKRMLAAKEPLICMSKNSDDGRSRVIALSPAGLSLIQSVLPEHLKSICSFAEVLTDKERDSLIIMLRKLLRESS